MLGLKKIINEIKLYLIRFFKISFKIIKNIKHRIFNILFFKTKESQKLFFQNENENQNNNNKPNNTNNLDNNINSDTANNVITANKYYIVCKKAKCYGCNKETQIWGILLPVENNEEQQENDTTMFVMYLEDLSSNVVLEIAKHTKYYRKDYSATTNSYYYMNHCEHCNAKIGDFFIYYEPDGCFSIINQEEKETEYFKFYVVNESFSGLSSEEG